MAFSLGTIGSYVDQNSYDLIAKSILGTNLAQVFNVRVGLQGKTVAIPLMSGDFLVQDGASCGFNASGDTTITQITMELANNKVNQTFCPQALRDTFLSQSLSAGAANGSFDFEAQVAEYFVKQLQANNEDFLINGKGSINGLKGRVVEANGAVKLSASTWTTSNALDKANAMYVALSGQTQLDGDHVLILSPSQFRVLKTALVQANLYHYNPDMGRDSLVIPGIDVQAIASSGLKGADINKKYLGPKSTLFLGTDLTSDWESFRIFLDEGEDIVKSIMRWRIGMQVSEVASWVYEG